MDLFFVLVGWRGPADFEGWRVRRILGPGCLNQRAAWGIRRIWTQVSTKKTRAHVLAPQVLLGGGQIDAPRKSASFAPAEIGGEKNDRTRRLLIRTYAKNQIEWRDWQAIIWFGRARDKKKEASWVIDAESEVNCVDHCDPKQSSAWGFAQNYGEGVQLAHFCVLCFFFRLKDWIALEVREFLVAIMQRVINYLNSSCSETMGADFDIQLMRWFSVISMIPMS